MTGFHDFLINSELEETAVKFGWSKKSLEAETKVIQADEWGELKQKINDNRASYEILAFKGGDHDLNRKVFSNSKMDLVLHPGKGRKDSGMNHIDAEKARENNVAVGFTLKQLNEDKKRQSQILSKWIRNIRICEKYGTPYLITTEAGKESELRRPRDSAAVLKSLGSEGNKTVSKYPGSILEKNLKAKEIGTDSSGVEVIE